jgi:hypothetical protein
MLSRDPQFRRIKLKARGLGGSATYWLGPDHLLIVAQDGYSERYRRIYFRDIQAVLIRRTSTWIWILVFLIGMLVVLGILPLTVGDTIGYWLGGINLGLWSAFLTVHLIAGPTCGCRLVTAVQNRDLPHLNRWKQAGRLLDALLPEVNRAQGRTSVAPTPTVESPPAGAAPTP